METECLIIGGGAAGLYAALTCRQYWPEKRVTLVEAEKEIGYYRTLLPLFITGKLEEDKLFFWQSRSEHLLDVRPGMRAVSLDRLNQTLQMGNGEKIKYDRLVLAPGGYPLMPRVCTGIPYKGIFPVRDLTTARTVRKWIHRHKKIVVLGGGFIGLKTAVSLAVAGFTVVLVEKEDHLLPQALSAEAARPVEEHLQRIGMQILLGCILEDIKAERGVLKSVQVGKKWLRCNTLLVAIGSTPHVGFLENSDVLDNGELVVPPTLQTRDERIYAAGDAVKISTPDGRQFTPWIWPQAVAQGKLAGANLYRSVPLSLKMLTRPNSMNLHGLSVVILGAPVPEAQVTRYSSPQTGIHRELFVQDGRIVGGALVGEVSGAGPLHAAMIAERKVGEGIHDLIQPRSRVLSQLVETYFSQQGRVGFLFHQEIPA